jgi:hypothetical protein
VGVLIIILLSLGLADPPHAPTLVWQTDSLDRWPLLQHANEYDFLIAPFPLPQSPFTLEITASNEGTSASAWGFWLHTADRVQIFQVSNNGYVSISADETSHWSQFLHIRPTTNKLYLDVQDDYFATFRVNDEIAWQGTITPIADWGVALNGAADINSQNIEIYAGR